MCVRTKYTAGRQWSTSVTWLSLASVYLLLLSKLVEVVVVVEDSSLVEYLTAQSLN